MPRQKIPDFPGPSYTERSVGLSADRTINMYPIVIDPKVRPPELALVGTPGLTATHTLPGGPVRLLWTATNGRVFGVGGRAFCELFPNGAVVQHGQVTAGAGRVSMDDNGLAAMVVDGTAGFVFTFGSNTWARVTDEDFPGADFVVYIDGYFAFNIPGTGRFGLTELFDPSAVDALGIATAEARADPLLRVHALHRELKLFGTLTVESWFNAGNPDFPFQQIQGTVVEQGLLAPDSLGVVDNTYLWLHQNSQGQGKVLSAQGYQTTAVSTPAQEAHWATYPRLDDALAWTYTQSGHNFYVLTFPSGDATWVLDLTTGFWHERAWHADDGTLHRHRGRVHTVGFGQHLVGDWQTGTVYRLDEQASTDDGQELVRVRRFPHVRADRQRLFHQTLEVHVEQGEAVGNPASLGVDPTITPRHLMLRWSNDGGHTFSDAHWRELGPRGAFAQRARWHKLGQARDRVYEVRMTSNHPGRWIAAYLDGQGGAH